MCEIKVVNRIKEISEIVKNVMFRHSVIILLDTVNRDNKSFR